MNKKFLTTFGKSFNPKSYPSLIKQYSLRRSYLHFLYLLVIVTIISGILYLPSFADKPQEIQEEFTKIQDINFIIDATSSDAARFGPITIDLDSNKSLEERGVLITKKRVEYKLLPFGASTVMKDGEVHEFIKNPKSQISLLSLITIFLAPYLLILLYTYHLLKYTLIVLILGTIIVILIRTSKGDIHAKPVYKAGFFATPFLMLELPLQTMTSSWFYHSLLPFLLFVIFYLVTIFFIKPKHLDEDINIKNKTKEQSEYIDGDIFAGSSFKKDFEKRDFGF